MACKTAVRTFDLKRGSLKKKSFYFIFLTFNPEEAASATNVTQSTVYECETDISRLPESELSGALCWPETCTAGCVQTAASSQ